MVRIVITPSDANIHFTIPNEYVGRPIEISYMAVDDVNVIESDTQVKKRTTMADFWGCLSEETGQKIKDEIKDAWA